MKNLLHKLGLTLGAIFLFSATVFAQGVRKDDFVINQAGKPIPNASVYICTTAATAAPCTGNLATIYSDAAETLPITQPLLTGPIGNFGFYATPGEYNYYVTGATIQGASGHYSIACTPSASPAGCGSGGGSGGVSPINTTTPLVGGPITTGALTISCPTCVTASGGGSITLTSGEVGFSLGGNAIGGNPNFNFDPATGFLTLPNPGAVYFQGVPGLVLSGFGASNIGIGTVGPLNGPNNGGNVGIGISALGNLTTGVTNTAIGGSAGKGITTGSFNVFIGTNTGINAPAAASFETVIGYGAGFSGIGNSSTAIGYQALLSAGAHNTAIGASVLSRTSNGTTTDNTIIGYQAGEGSSITTYPYGSYNIVIGEELNAVPSLTTGSHNILLGNSLTGITNTGNYQLDIGDVLTGTGLNVPSTSVLTVQGLLAVTGNLTINATGSTQCLQANTSGVVSGSGASCGATAFSTITSGTNTAAAMVLGTGSSLTVSGSGTNNATTLLANTWAIPGTIGSSTPNTGAFTTLSASSTVSGTGFSTYLASPPSIGGTAPAAGAFTTLSATGNLTTNVTGSTQCLHVNSAGVVSGLGSDCGASAASTSFSGLTSATNTSAAMVVGTGASLTVSGSGTINATTLLAGTWAIPGTIGSGTPNTAAFTTLSASSTVSGAGFSTYLASPPAIGGSAPAAGAFTTLSASSTVSGSGFSTYLASPPAIGGSAPAAGAFTTLSATSTISGAGFTAYLASPPAIGGTSAAAGSFTTLKTNTFNAAAVIASGTTALGTSAIASGACATVVTATATSAATTDNLIVDDNASDLSSVAGYGVSSAGTLSVYKQITSGNVNFKVCNSTTTSITPGSLTIQWRVVR